MIFFGLHPHYMVIHHTYQRFGEHWVWVSSSLIWRAPTEKP